MFKVLVVDDSEIVCIQLKRLKVWGEPSGFVIAGEASDGEIALQRLRSEHFDLVITDIRMPKLDGVELLIQVTKEKLAPCVVFMSGFSEFEYAKQGLVYGAFDYLVKPVCQEDIGRLLIRVRECLLSQRREAERVSRAIKTAGSWMPSEEIDQIITSLQCGTGNPLAIAETIVDRVKNFCGNDSLRAGYLLTDVLREISSFILTEKPWIDYYADLPGLIEQLGRTTGYYFVDRGAFLRSIEEMVAVTKQFSPCEDKGKIVREATRYIITHIDEGIAVRDIAAALFVNRTYMSEVFKKKMGVAVSEYLTEMKMARALRLLSISELRTSDIAERLGYSDVNYFSRQFRQTQGMSIEEYRLRKVKNR